MNRTDRRPAKCQMLSARCYRPSAARCVLDL